MATILRRVPVSNLVARSRARPLSWGVLLALLGTAGVADVGAQAPIVVFPDSATVAPRLLSGGPYQASFLIQHKGDAEALAFTCSGTGGITCTGIAPAPARGPSRPAAATPEPTAAESATAESAAAPSAESSPTASPPPAEFACTKGAAVTCSSAESSRGRLGQGRLTRVVVTYTASALGVGTLVLRAQGETSGQVDTGRLTIPIVAAVDSAGAVAPDTPATGTSSTGTPSTGQ